MDVTSCDGLVSSPDVVVGGAATADVAGSSPTASCQVGAEDNKQQRTLDPTSAWGTGGVHLGALEPRPMHSQQLVASSPEPAHVFSGLVSLKDSFGSGRTSSASPYPSGLAGFNGQPAYVRTTSSLLTASWVLPEVPSISFIEEFTSLDADEQGDKHVDVAFEVSATHSTKVSNITVEVHSCNIKQDSWELAFPDDADAFGMFRLQLPNREKPWSLQLIIKDSTGKAMGGVASLSLPGKRPEKGRLAAQDFGSAISSVTTAVGAMSIMSTGSSTRSFSSRGSDTEGSGAEQDL